MAGTSPYLVKRISYFFKIRPERSDGNARYDDDRADAKARIVNRQPWSTRYERRTTRVALVAPGGGVRTPANAELQQCGKLFYRKIGLSDNCSEGSTIQFFVIRHNDLAKRISPAKNDVATFLPSNREPYSFKRLDACASRDARQFAHTAMRTASKCSSGTGRLSSFRAAT